MDFTIYQKPSLISFAQHPPKGSHITVSEAGGRIYFSNDIVEKYKLLSFPPSFAITNQNEWIVLFTKQFDNSFSLMEYRGTYYFHYSDIVHRILSAYGKKKVHFSLNPTDLPFAFFLTENIQVKGETAKKKYSHERTMLANPIQSHSVNYYDKLMDSIINQ